MFNGIQQKWIRFFVPPEKNSLNLFYNKKLIKLFEDGRSLKGEKEIHEHFQKVNKHILKEGIMLPLGYKKFFSAYNSRKVLFKEGAESKTMHLDLSLYELR